MRTKKKVAIVLLCLVIIGAFLLLTSHFDDWLQPLVESGHFSARENEREMKTVMLNGEPYLPDDHVKTFLLIGLDSTGKAGSSGGYYNTDQADFIMVAAVNTETGTCRFLQINRDTMTEVDQLGISGAKYGSRVEQIALSHTYGDGTAHSCLNVASAVSNLLHGVKIDYYLSMTMDAVSILNDYVGGVSVTMDEDYSEIHPSFRKGETVLLTGDMAMALVRTRGGAAEPTNVARMKRQKLYIDAFQRKVFGGTPKSDAYWMDAYSAISDYVVTNCDTVSFSALVKNMNSYQCFDVVSPDGEAKKGSEFMEFYVDEQHLQTLVAEMFFRRAD
ncbi:MAG: LCP family protein [Ruminococcus sp.]|nr:LCP family protein [Candidatus Apopatosoma intestinale]